MDVPQHPQPQSQSQPQQFDSNQLLMAIVQIGHSISSQNAQQQAMLDTINLLTQQVQAISVARSSPHSTTAKFNPPSTFTGQAIEVKDFLIDIWNSVTLQPHSFCTDPEKSIYMSMFFAPSMPKMWFSSVSNIVKSNFACFCDSFEKHFGNFDPQATANSQLCALCQEHCGSAANYYSRYNELCSRVDWSDFTLIDTFHEGLKPCVKSALKYVREKDRPKTFKEFAELCIEFDNLAWREEQDLRREKGETFSTESSEPAPTVFITQMLPTPLPTLTPPIYTMAPPPLTPQPMYTPVTSAPAYTSPPIPILSNEPTPMEIDAMRSRPRGPLTEAERLKRKQDGLCMYCGAAGHLKNKCPNRSPEAIHHFNAQASSSTPNSST